MERRPESNQNCKGNQVLRRPYGPIRRKVDACSEMGGQSIAITRRKDKGLKWRGYSGFMNFGHNKHLWHTDDQSTVMHVPVAEESTKLSSEDFVLCCAKVKFDRNVYSYLKLLY